MQPIQQICGICGRPLRVDEWVLRERKPDSASHYFALYWCGCTPALSQRPCIVQWRRYRISAIARLRDYWHGGRQEWVRDRYLNDRRPYVAEVWADGLTFAKGELIDLIQHANLRAENHNVVLEDVHVEVLALPFRHEDVPAPPNHFISQGHCL